MNADETINYLRKSCNGCENGCCEFEVLGVAAADLIERQAREIERLKETKHGAWISVKDDLPDSGERVLAYNGADDICDMFTYYRKGDILENELSYKARVELAKKETNATKRLFILMFATDNVPAPDDGFYFIDVNDQGLTVWRKHQDCITHWMIPTPPEDSNN